MISPVGDAWKRALLAIAAVAVLAIASISISKLTVASDLAGFICDASTMTAGADPYRVEPIRTCEHRLLPGAFMEGKVLPATAPAYVLPPFELLALLPFGVVQAIFTFFEIAAAVVTIVTLRRISQAPLLALIVVLVVPGLYVSTLTGQVAIFAVAAAVLCADALAAGRFRLASVWATAGMIEPHLGLPVVVTVALCVRQTRLPIVAGLGVLGLVTLFSPHLGYTFEYFSAVLPSQLRSELHYNAQIGTAHLLTVAGMPDGLALHLASFGYTAAMLGMAVLLFRCGARSPLLVVAPLALSIAVAPYGHVTQCFAAIPFLVVLGDRPNLAQRTVAAFVLPVFAIPILAFGPNAPQPWLAASFAALAGLCAARIHRLPLAIAAAVVGANAAFTFRVAALFVPDPAPSAGIAAKMLAVAPTEFAQKIWQLFIEDSLTFSGPASTLAKAGLWVALFATVALAVATASIAGRRVSPHGAAP